MCLDFLSAERSVRHASWRRQSNRPDRVFQATVRFPAGAAARPSHSAVTGTRVARQKKGGFLSLVDFFCV